jgi:tetratricopeptide (TPR) repeat protein
VRSSFLRLAVGCGAALVLGAASGCVPSPRPAARPVAVEPRPRSPKEEAAARALRSSAAAHHNAGRKALEAAIEAQGDAGRPGLEKAAAELSTAAGEWQRLLSLNEAAKDAAETRFWLAEALYLAVTIRGLLDPALSPGDFDAARAAAKQACAAGTGEWLSRSCNLIVAVATRSLENEKRKHDRSGGKEGFAPRDDLVVKDPGGPHPVIVKEPVPPQLLDMIAALDEYAARVPPSADVDDRLVDFQSRAADYYFLYGQFDEARRRFAAMDPEKHGGSPGACRAWERLLAMANLERDEATAYRMARSVDRNGCWEGRPPFGNRTIADEALRQALELPEGAERRAAFLKAASAYEKTLAVHPDFDKATIAAINGAYAYRQVGQFDRAIAMYLMYVKGYGAEDRLAAVEKSVPDHLPERVKYLHQACESLATAHVLTFDYEAAADTFETIAGQKRFQLQERKDAAHNALILRLNLGQKANAAAAREVLRGLGEDAAAKAEADLRMARGGFQAWEPHADDSEALRRDRKAAQAALEKYVKTHRRDREAEKLVAEAESLLARTRPPASPGTAKKQVVKKPPKSASPPSQAVPTGMHVAPPPSAVAPPVPATK